MTASRASRGAGLGLALLTLAVLPAAAQLRTGQDPDKPLPSVTVRPSKPATAPKILGPKPNDSAPSGPRGDKPQTFELRVDPKTGEPLSAEELRRRDESRSTMPPRDSATAKNDANRADSANGDGEVTADGIEVKRLGSVDAASVGLLEENDGGFGFDMWRGASRSLVLSVLPQVPIPDRSPAMRSLARRLLLSTARAPAGEGDGDLLALRLGRLVDGGWYGDAVNLLRQLPGGEIGPRMASIQLDAQLLRGNVRESCQLVRNYIARSDDTAWQKAAAFCLAVEGKPAQAELYEQLLYEQGVEDPPFFKLLAALTGRDAGPVSTLPRPTPLHLAMFRAARKALPEDTLVQASPALMRTVATSPNATLQLRLQAAEAALAAGLLEVDLLRRIYASVPFTAAERADALAQAEAREPQMASALLYQVAQIESQPANRARVIRKALQRASGEGRHAVVAAANHDVLMAMQPSPKLAWFAGNAGRALLVAGEWEQARSWLLAMLEPARNKDETAVAAVLELAPLMFIGDPQEAVPVNDQALEGWWRAQEAMARKDRFARATLLFGLLEAFDLPVPPALWDDLVGGPPATGYVPAPAVQRQLTLAANAGQRGKTVMLALMALGPDGPTATAPSTVGSVVAALRSVGLPGDARAIALEAMIGRGF